MRLLVHAQDQITRLEEELDNIDQQESNLLFLAANRLDSNPNRLRVLKNLDRALEVYGEYNSQLFDVPDATAQSAHARQMAYWIEIAKP